MPIKRVKHHTVKALRWSERYTKTDMVYLFGQSSWLFVGQGTAFVLSFALAWVFANYVSPADYGLYKFVLTVATFATVTTLTGFGVATARAIAQGQAVSLPRLIATKIRFGLIGTAGLLATALYYVYLDNTLLATLFAITAIWIPFYESYGDFTYVLQGKKDFQLQTILRTSQRFFMTTVTISAILLSSNIVVITSLYFAAYTLSQYLVYRYTIHKYPAGADETTPYAEIIDYGKKLSLQNIFFIGAGQIDKLLLFKFLGPTQLAIYFFAIALPQELQGVLGNINAVAFPKLVDKRDHHFKVALVKKILLYTIVLAIPVLAYVALAPFLFAFFFPAYTDSIAISQLYAGTIFFTPASVFWHYFYAIEDRQALFYGTILGPGSFILSLLILVPTMGLTGAVMAVYIRGVVDLVSALIFFARVKPRTETI